MLELSVVIPCYNEARNIHIILEKFSAFISNKNIELVLVNNGSKDNTQDVLAKELKKERYGFARSVRIDNNIGYGHGVIFGLKHCKGEFLAYSHADLQCDPADIITAYKEIKKTGNPRNTLIKGIRTGRNSIISTFFLILANVLFLKKFSDINAQPKVFHKSFLNKLKNPPNGFGLDLYVQYIALKNGMDIINIPVKFGERRYGKSSWSSSIKSRIITIMGFIGYIIKLRIFGS